MENSDLHWKYPVQRERDLLLVTIVIELDVCLSVMTWIDEKPLFAIYNEGMCRRIRHIDMRDEGSVHSCFPGIIELDKQII